MNCGRELGECFFRCSGDLVLISQWHTGNPCACCDGNHWNSPGILVLRSVCLPKEMVFCRMPVFETDRRQQNVCWPKKIKFFVLHCWLFWRWKAGKLTSKVCKQALFYLEKLSRKSSGNIRIKRPICKTCLSLCFLSWDRKTGERCFALRSVGRMGHMKY